MIFDIEFIRRIEGKAESLALDVVRLVGDSLAAVTAKAEDLYRNMDIVPPPDGFRILGDGAVVYEFMGAPHDQRPRDE